MASFITRVELHDEQDEDYPKLHEAMEALKFQRTVKLGDQVQHLPDATYFSTSEGTAQAVYDLALAAVKSIGRKAGIIVAKAQPEGLWAGGLKAVKPLKVVGSK
jgi:hypothetical protein